MTNPTNDDVKISQSKLNTYASTIETFVGVMGPYIAQLKAGQTPQLSDADVSALDKAITDAEALEPPPAPTP